MSCAYSLYLQRRVIAVLHVPRATNLLQRMPKTNILESRVRMLSFQPPTSTQERTASRLRSKYGFQNHNHENRIDGDASKKPNGR